MWVFFLCFIRSTIQFKHIHSSTSMCVITFSKHFKQIFITAKMCQAPHFQVTKVTSNYLLPLLSNRVNTSYKDASNLILIIFLCFRKLLPFVIVKALYPLLLILYHRMRSDYIFIYNKHILVILKLQSIALVDILSPTPLGRTTLSSRYTLLTFLLVLVRYSPIYKEGFTEFTMFAVTHHCVMTHNI